MKNSKLRRALLLAACAVMLVCLSVGATLAYLTSHDTVVNTFTVGQVKIELDEGKVHDPNTMVDGEDIGGTFIDEDNNRIDNNTYKFLPGHDLDKDPTVTVKAGSENCYVRIMVTVTRLGDLMEIIGETDKDVAAAKLASYITGYNDDDFDDNKWTFGTDSVTYEFRLTDIVELDKDNDQKFELFKGIDVPEELTVEQLALLQVDLTDTDTTNDVAMTITAEAHAIQADGFADANAAWNAFKK